MILKDRAQGKIQHKGYVIEATSNVVILAISASAKGSISSCFAMESPQSTDEQS